jgi:hypothetical protein
LSCRVKLIFITLASAQSFLDKFVGILLNL